MSVFLKECISYWSQVMSSWGFSLIDSITCQTDNMRCIKQLSIGWINPKKFGHSLLKEDVWKGPDTLNKRKAHASTTWCLEIGKSRIGYNLVNSSGYASTLPFKNGGSNRFHTRYRVDTSFISFDITGQFTASNILKTSFVFIMKWIGVLKPHAHSWCLSEFSFSTPTLSHYV